MPRMAWRDTMDYESKIYSIGLWPIACTNAAGDESPVRGVARLIKINYNSPQAAVVPRVGSGNRDGDCRKEGVQANKTTGVRLLALQFRNTIFSSTAQLPASRSSYTEYKYS